jgi:hypothetical protein
MWRRHVLWHMIYRHIDIRTRRSFGFSIHRSLYRPIDPLVYWSTDTSIQKSTCRSTYLYAELSISHISIGFSPHRSICRCVDRYIDLDRYINICRSIYWSIHVSFIDRYIVLSVDLSTDTSSCRSTYLSICDLSVRRYIDLSLPDTLLLWRVTVWLKQLAKR